MKVECGEATYRAKTVSGPAAGLIGGKLGRQPNRQVERECLKNSHCTFYPILLERHAQRNDEDGWLNQATTKPKNHKPWREQGLPNRIVLHQHHDHHPSIHPQGYHADATSKLKTKPRPSSVPRPIGPDLAGGSGCMLFHRAAQS